MFANEDLLNPADASAVANNHSSDSTCLIAEWGFCYKAGTVAPDDTTETVWSMTYKQLFVTACLIDATEKP
jgi:hypothetical protein